jgi:hypothetical protein
MQHRGVRHLSTLILAALLGWQTVGAADPQDESYKGATTDVMDLKVTAVKLRANTAPCMFWADDKGTAFYTLDPVGTIRKISFPDLGESQKIELNKKCLWLAPSAQGLVVTMADQAVWLIDPANGTVRKKIAVPSVKRAESAWSLSTAFAANGKDLYEVDLKKGTARKYGGAGPKYPGHDNPVVTPNGKYLFTRGRLEEMHRFGIKGGKATFEQTSPRIQQGRVDIGIQVSPDSKFVTLPCYAGNYTAGKYGNIFVYPVENIERPEVALEFGGPSAMAISADPASGNFYADDLRVFDKDGSLKKQYKLGAGPMQQLLVHPEGGKLLIMGRAKFLLVEVPK